MSLSLACQCQHQELFIWSKMQCFTCPGVFAWATNSRQSWLQSLYSVLQGFGINSHNKHNSPQAMVHSIFTGWSSHPRVLTWSCPTVCSPGYWKQAANTTPSVFLMQWKPTYIMTNKSWCDGLKHPLKLRWIILSGKIIRFMWSNEKSVTVFKWIHEQPQILWFQIWSLTSQGICPALKLFWAPPKPNESEINVKSIKNKRS